jgi:glycosyltransferase involved in cell wall biosynthesis
LNDCQEKDREATGQINHYKSKIADINDLNQKYYDDIENLNQKYREATGQINHYKSRLAYTDAELKKLKTEIATLQNALMIAKQFKINFEECRASSSYQLGHLLIHETRSIRDLLHLPRKIKNIRSKKQIPSKKIIDKNSQNINDSKLPTVLSKVSAEKNKTDFVKTFAMDKKTGELKIACIMDVFTYESYSHEAVFQQLTPQGWKNELKTFSPDLLFIESAWRGKDELWWNTVGKKCDELVDIIKYCNKHHIPTVFWNKEDPVHFNTFINTAALFDFVFTTDMDIIDRYKKALQHDRVYLLPFACQPKVNNPIEKYQRNDAFCFAGAYYVRYPERTKDLDEFMIHLSEIKPIEIYDRNYGKDDSTYMFPDQFKPFIVGTLPFEDIDKAYKGYNYAINLNSVKQSQSMFARRVYEVLASNTLIISNFSKAVRLLFGDLVITSDSGTEIVKRVIDLTKDELALKKHKLIALRKVLSEHTYQNRLEYLVSKVFNKKVENSSPLICMICFAKDETAFTQCLKNFDKQMYQNKNLLIVSDHFKHDNNRDDIKIINFDTAEKKTLTDISLSSNYIALVNINDYYGENYLTDLALSSCYFDGAVIGKASYYLYADSNEILLQNKDMQYHIVNSLSLFTSIIKEEELSSIKIGALQKISQSSDLGNLECLSIDEFNYCKNGNGLYLEKTKFLQTDTNKFDGISMNELIEHSEKKTTPSTENLETRYLSGALLAHSINQEKAKEITFTVKDDVASFNSTMNSKVHQNIYAQELHAVTTLDFAKKQQVYLDMNVGLNLMLIVFYLDEKKQKISYESVIPNQNAELLIPDNAKWILFGFRIQGSGSATLKGLLLKHKTLNPSVIVGQADHLILSNHYPSYDDLYRNGFIHARVKAYQEHGTKVDVFRLHENTEISYNEFENVDVTTGSSDALRKLLENNSYKSILVHFLDAQMWDVVKDYVGKIKVFVWVHGFEIQAWHHRKHNFTTIPEQENEKHKSNERIKFWQSILNKPHSNLKLIFVSQYLVDSTMDDLKLQIPKENFAIVHNFINADLFKYIPKDIEQRKRILSIRPYANKNYANDLSVKAIQELSKKPYFNELEFMMIGDGILFDETLEPIKNYPNVHIEKCFLSQTQIAVLHKGYGLFLCPSRIDTQGVSRDEAMSSGLIPVTNAVTAIPEFVDETCGILADGEDAYGLAEGIAKLYENPELFQKMSEAAAKRVREQSGFKQTIDKELELFSLTAKKETLEQASLENQQIKKKILIFGSCVSRDIFNLENNFQLVNYFARSSFASIFQTPFSYPEVAKRLESKFQEKIVEADMKKTILLDLIKGDFDILLLDFIDERFNLLLLNGTVCTLSNEAISTGLAREYPDHEIIKSGSEQFFEMWEEGWRKFIGLMRENGQLEKVVLNKVYYAEQTISGGNFEPTYPKTKIVQMNIFLDKLYAIAEKSLFLENIMSFSKNVIVGADEHQWGKSPFHYVEKYYQDALFLLQNKNTNSK